MDTGHNSGLEERHRQAEQSQSAHDIHTQDYNLMSCYYWRDISLCLHDADFISCHELLESINLLFGSSGNEDCDCGNTIGDAKQKTAHTTLW